MRGSDEKRGLDWRRRDRDVRLRRRAVVRDAVGAVLAVLAFMAFLRSVGLL